MMNRATNVGCVRYSRVVLPERDMNWHFTHFIFFLWKKEDISRVAGLWRQTRLWPVLVAGMIAVVALTRN